MARNYAALPYDYLEEMEALNDAEFGRLTRALLAYSMTGEQIALCGNERFYAKRVMSQEDRFIIEDKGQDFNRDMQLLDAGIMNDWEFRARWMNEDEATAKAALPKMQDMTTEQQNEVE